MTTPAQSQLGAFIRSPLRVRGGAGAEGYGIQYALTDTWHVIAVDVETMTEVFPAVLLDVPTNWTSPDFLYAFDVNAPGQEPLCIAKYSNSEIAAFNANGSRRWLVADDDTATRPTLTGSGGETWTIPGFPQSAWSLCIGAEAVSLYTGKEEFVNNFAPVRLGISLDTGAYGVPEFAVLPSPPEDNTPETVSFLGMRFGSTIVTESHYSAVALPGGPVTQLENLDTQATANLGSDFRGEPGRAYTGHDPSGRDVFKLDSDPDGSSANDWYVTDTLVLDNTLKPTLGSGFRGDSLFPPDAYVDMDAAGGLTVYRFGKASTAVDAQINIPGVGAPTIWRPVRISEQDS